MTVRLPPARIGAGVVAAALIAAPAAPAEPRFEQATATATVTRVFGPIPSLFGRTGHLAGRAEVPLRDAAALARRPPVATLLVGDTGDAARVRLRQPPVPRGDGLWTMELQMTDVDRAGTFTGVLRLDPDAPATSQLEVTMRVQDFIVWPLLVLIAGALLGGLGRRYVEVVRERARIRDALVRAHRAYAAAQEHRPANLDPLSEATMAEFAGVLDGVRRARTADALTQGAEAASGAAARLARWVALRNGYVALRAEVDGLPPEAPPGSDAVRDARELLAGEPPDVDDADAVAAHVRLVADQTGILAAMAAVWRERARLRALGDAQDMPRGTDPEDPYGLAGAPIARGPEDVRLLLDRLADMARALRLVVAERSGQQRLQTAGATSAPAVLALTGAPVPTAPTAPVAGPSLVAVPDPEDLEADVRVLDLAMFAVTVLVVALAYLLPFYVGKAYGGWDDYLSAFLAGFAGMLVIPWDRLPLFAPTLRPAKADGA